MKKLLVLLVVLGMTSFAGAELIFNVDGEPQPDTIYLNPSETVEIGLGLAAGENILKYTITYSLSNEQAEFVFPDPQDIGGLSVYGLEFPWASMFPGKVSDYDDVGVMSWVKIAADNFMQATPGPLTLMQGLILHCTDNTPLTMTVTVVGDTTVDGQSIPIDTVLHTLNIVQPEPMTIALLGLGGLFLRRRK